MINDINAFSRPHFIPELKDKASTLELKLVKEADNQLIFSNKHQIINYLINTSMPEHLDKINDYEYLIVRGHDPHNSILNNIKTKLIFIGFADTSYHYEPNEADGVVSRLHTEINFRKKFHHFIWFDENFKQHDFTCWNEFCSFVN